MRATQPVSIWGLGTYLPSGVVTNADLEKLVDTSDDWIISRTGIRERRRVEPEVATSDLCLLAAQEALEDAGITARDLDLIIVATVTPDHFFPATACLVQDRLGATRAAAFDLEAGCTNFMYGLVCGSQFIASGMYRHVLVLAGDTLSKIVDWTDRGTCILFGDGVGAAVLGPARADEGLLAFKLGSDGGGGMLLQMPAGGSRYPSSLATVDQRMHFIKMQGNEVFKFAVRVMEEASLSVLAECGLSTHDVDFLIPHQANIRIVEAARRRLELPTEKVYINLDRYGNMSGASIPVALTEAVRGGRIKPGDLVLMVGFGAGLTWGASVMRWGGSRNNRG